jgi:hypothetical protein
MIENINVETDKSSASVGRPPFVDSGRTNRHQETRRRLLTTGIAATGASIVTLSNRSALGQAVCSISMTLSHNPSQQLSSATCGDSPGCWATHANSSNAKAWTDAGFSPGESFLTAFSMFSIAGWELSNQAATLLDVLDGTVTLTATLKNTHTGATATAAFSGGQLAQLVAAALNAGFYGYPAYFEPLGSPNTSGTIYGDAYKMSGSGAVLVGNDVLVNALAKTMQSFISSQTSIYASQVRNETCPT